MDQTTKYEKELSKNYWSKGKSFHDLELVKNYFKYIPKSQTIKENIEILDDSKI